MAGAAKKQTYGYPKVMPSPADFRALGSYGRVLMDQVRNEHRKRMSGKKG